MSSSSIDVLVSDGSVFDVASLLALGASVIAQTRQARSKTRYARVHATWLRYEAYSLMMRFSPDCFQPISGADGFAEETERTRNALRAFALYGTAKTFVGLSRGATCDSCGRSILGGEIEYELVADGHEMRLESDCYLLFVDELERLQPPPPDSAR